jgi:hypothetical protein
MRRNLTAKQRIRGLRTAIVSPRTPAELKQPLVRQLRKLEASQPKKRRRASARRKVI